MSARNIHFIAGLPRSGSTLLAAILNQNPAFRAAMSSPVFGIFNACVQAMGGSNEYAMFLSDTQRTRIARGVFEGYYAEEQALTQPKTCFDTNRMWPARLSAVHSLYPEARMICCVRNPAWILDSLEHLLRKNPLETSRMFGSEAERATVYSRAEALMQPSRLIGSAYLALREAYHSADARALLLLDYETLVAHPKDAMALVCQFLGEPPFPHDFSAVTYQAEAFDAALMARGLHDVSGQVAPRPRPTILPPDLFQRFSAMQFWTKGNTLAHAIRAETEPVPAQIPTPS